MTFSGIKEKTIGAALKEWLKESGIDDKINETRLLNEWENVVGAVINQHTISKRISKQVLFIKLDSASLRHELGYAREKLCKQLNNTVDKEIIKTIVFT